MNEDRIVASKDFTNAPLCLSGRGVTKVFGIGDKKTVAVDHVDFDFHVGEFVSIVDDATAPNGNKSLFYNTSGKENAEKLIFYVDVEQNTDYVFSAGEESNWCVMQIVREPWKYWAFAGIIMMLAGAFLLFIQGPKRRNTITD